MFKPDLKHFNFWCYKVLPLVYDNSLSYYEVLCKVVDYINKLIDQDKVFGDELAALRQDLEEVQNWIANFDTSYIKDLIDKYLATFIIVSLNADGYFVYTIPESWEVIQFNTTGLDIDLELQPEYGHLVLSY